MPNSDLPSGRRLRKLAWAALAGGALLTLAVTGQEKKPAHLMDQECQTCHLAQEKVTGDKAKMLVASQEKLCASCHPDAIRLSHPSGFPPERELPAAFPLDWKGDLTCSSCHAIHGQTQGLMLSESRGMAFCLSCHDEAFFEEMPDQGESMALSGHLAAGGIGNDILDAFSQQCISCHEKGTDGVVAVAQGLARHGGEGALSHPVGGNYDDAVSYGGYRARAALPAEIVLPEGKVSCISCHQGYSKIHGGLVLSNESSGLCMACHDL